MCTLSSYLLRGREEGGLVAGKEAGLCILPVITVYWYPWIGSICVWKIRKAGMHNSSHIIYIVGKLEGRRLVTESDPLGCTDQRRP